MVMGKVKDSKITDEENKIRQDEDKLFEKMKSAPSRCGDLTEILNKAQNNTQTESQQKLPKN